VHHEQPVLGEAEAILKPPEGRYALAGFQLIDFRRHDQRVAADRPKPVDGLHVVRTQDPTFHQHDDRAQLFALAEICFDQWAPLRPFGFRHLGIPVARKIGEYEARQ